MAFAVSSCLSLHTVINVLAFFKSKEVGVSSGRKHFRQKQHLSVFMLIRRFLMGSMERSDPGSSMV